MKYKGKKNNNDSFNNKLNGLR